MNVHCSSPEGIFLSTDPRADRWKGYLSSVVLYVCPVSVAILASPHRVKRNSRAAPSHAPRTIRVDDGTPGTNSRRACAPESVPDHRRPQTSGSRSPAPRLHELYNVSAIVLRAVRFLPVIAASPFFPIKDELAVRLEGSKACLQCSQHRYRHLGVTFLKCICNNFALAGDAVLALGDELLSLTGSLITPNPHLPPASPLRMPGSST
jgi:hypothetical protein